MSTNYHTPITVGAAANASVVNSPLAELDDRVTANVARIADLFLSSNVRVVDAAFVTSAAQKRHATISDAIANASAGDTILVSRGSFSGNITMSQDRVKIIGMGPAYYDGSTISGGTIIAGTLNLNGKKGCEIRNLTVNVSGSAADGLKSGTMTVGAYANTIIDNVTVIGSGPGNLFHGILIQTGDYCHISNVRVYGFTHGLAIKSPSVNISNVFTEDCDSSAIIIKSDLTGQSIRYVNVDNVIIKGSSSQKAGPIIVMSDEDAYVTEYININNVAGEYNDPALIWITRQAAAGTLQHINVSNCTSVNCTDDLAQGGAAFWSDGADDVTFTNCQAKDAAEYSFQNTGSGSRVSINGGHSINPGAGDTNGPFDNRDIVGKPNNAVHVYRTANQLIGNAAWTSLLWDAELFDESGMHSTSSNTSRLVALCAGTYEVAAMVRFDANATGNRFIRIDPSNAAAGAEVSMANMGASTHTAVVTHATYTLAAGDYVEIQCYQNSGGDLNALGAASQSHATMRKV